MVCRAAYQDDEPQPGEQDRPHRLFTGDNAAATYMEAQGFLKQYRERWPDRIFSLRFSEAPGDPYGRYQWQLIEPLGLGGSHG